VTCSFLSFKIRKFGFDEVSAERALGRVRRKVFSFKRQY